QIGQDPDPAVLAAFTAHARRVLGTADRVSVLVGHLAARRGVTAQVRDLAVAGNLPVAVVSAAKGDFPESDPRFAGLYAGPPWVRRAPRGVGEPGVLIRGGARGADAVGGGAPRLPAPRRIDLGLQARIGDVAYPGVDLREALTALTEAVRPVPP